MAKDKILTWQDIFDLGDEGITEMKGSFLGVNDVKYDFEARWNDLQQRWIVNYWIA